MNSWIKKDLQYNWHPYTQMSLSNDFPPILIEKAKGIKLYDNNGKIYLDTISSWWCNIHGHNHPKIVKTIKDQLKKLDHVLFAGFTHKPAIILSEKIISITPKNLTKVFYSDDGSTAVETALKMSFQYWQNTGKKNKIKFISLDNGYHGDTIGAMSISGVNLFNSVFNPLFFSSLKIPAPYCYRCPISRSKESCNIECANFLEDILKKNHNEISALIIEPLVLAAGGMIVYPKEYLEKIYGIIKKYNIHLILDEVATGFGRTGKMFACQHLNIEPDFMCLSKGLTSGTLPMGITLATEKIYQAFFDTYNGLKTFFHGHTYTANPIACSAAIANLEIFKKENTLDKVKKLVPMFHAKLDEFNSLKYAGDIRKIGMIGAIELVKDKKTKELFAKEKKIGLEIYKKGLKEGLLLRPLGNIIYFYFPLCIKEKEINTILNKTYKIIMGIKE